MSASSGASNDASNARQAWATLVTFLNALSQARAAARHLPRARVLIFDRHVLDSVVRMRFLYGEGGLAPLQRRLIRAVAPRARVSFLLDIRPETSLVRKDDIWGLEQLTRHVELYREEQRRLPVLRLDGERPREELCAEIARTVWAALP